MNKEAFKQRMQSLKSYREQNPGKGYWDFKSYEEGGEVPPTNKPTVIEPIPYKGKLYSDRYGRKYTEEQVYDYYNNGTDEIDRFTGGPLVRGLKPLLDLEDAANFTPVGDAVAAYDVYDAVSNRDWSGAGLAALGLVPFMPMTVKQFRSKYKGITPKTKSKGGYGHNFNTSVNKNITNNQLDNIINTSAEDLAKRTKAVNQSYNAAERLMDDPEYITRANQVKRQFGDDYTTAYADIINAYNDDPTKLPKLAEINDKLSSATGTISKMSDLIDMAMIMPQYPIPNHKDGGIHIKKKNRGKFNALKKRTGKTTEELTHSKNPLTRKRAIFAQNAKKWKHKGRKKK